MVATNYEEDHKCLLERLQDEIQQFKVRRESDYWLNIFTTQWF